MLAIILRIEDESHHDVKTLNRLSRSRRPLGHMTWQQSNRTCVEICRTYLVRCAIGKTFPASYKSLCPTHLHCTAITTTKQGVIVESFDKRFKMLRVSFRSKIQSANCSANDRWWQSDQVENKTVPNICILFLGGCCTNVDRALVFGNSFSFQT